jgi:hypothetical protein
VQLKGLDGKSYSISLKQNKKRSCSKLHEAARLLIKSIYNFDIVLEEVRIPGSRPAIFMDFIIPKRRVCVEVQGQQHYEYSGFFHDTKMDFYAGKRRDQKKVDWAELNNFRLIELPYNEDIDEWRKRFDCP